MTLQLWHDVLSLELPNVVCVFQVGLGPHPTTGHRAVDLHFTAKLTFTEHLLVLLDLLDLARRGEA